MQPFCSGKAKSITYLFWMCICSFRYPACKAHSPYFDLWPVWLYLIFPHYLINGMIFGKKIVIEREICVLISPQLLSETFPILRSIELDIKMYTSLHIKFPLFLFDFNETWTFSTYFRKILNISNFMKIRPRGRRDTTKLIIAFRNFCEKRLKTECCKRGR